MRYTYGTRIKRRRVVVRQLRFLQVYSRGSSAHNMQCETGADSTVSGRCRNGVDRSRSRLESDAASFVANYHSSLWTSCNHMESPWNPITQTTPKMGWFMVVGVIRSHGKQQHSIERIRVPISFPYYVPILHCF